LFLQRKQPGARLVATDDVPDIPLHAGLTTWRVPLPGHVFADLASEAPGLRASLFPPPPGPDAALAQELMKCRRALPHTSHGGGFFVAVFERAVNDPVAHECPKAGSLDLLVLNYTFQQFCWLGVELQAWGRPLFVPLTEFPDVWKDIVDFYGLDLAVFPFKITQLFARTASGQPAHVCE
jgi:hypothetical protein